MMSTSDTFNQILNRLEHLDREKSEDLSKLKKIILSSTKVELITHLEELDLIKIISVFKRLLKCDEKFINEDISDIFNQILDTLGIDDYYVRFENLIKIILKDDSAKLKSIHLKLLFKCSKDVKVQASLIENGLLDLIIENMGDENEEVAKHSMIILKYLSVKIDQFLEDQLFNQSHSKQLESIKNKNAITILRYYEFLIGLVLEKETFLLNQHIQQGIKELLDLTIKSTDDPLIVRNGLEILDKLVENNKGIEYLVQFGYFNFISFKILNPQSDLLNNLTMPGYIQSFSKLGSTSPDHLAHHQNVISQIIDCISSDDFMPDCIESIGLIGRLAKGKLILNSNQKFIFQCLPKLGGMLQTGNHYKIEVLNCLSSLFDLNDQDATVEISNLLDSWYSKLLNNDRKKTTQTIYLLSKQAFQDVHINTLNLIRILCKHSWGQNEFAQLNTFLEYLFNHNSEVDYKSKEAKFKLIQELATSPFTTKNFGGINHAKLRKLHKEGAFYVDRDVTVAVEGV